MIKSRLQTLERKKGVLGDAFRGSTVLTFFIFVYKVNLLRHQLATIDFRRGPQLLFL